MSATIDDLPRDALAWEGFLKQREAEVQNAFEETDLQTWRSFLVYVARLESDLSKSEFADRHAIQGEGIATESASESTSRSMLEDRRSHIVIIQLLARQGHEALSAHETQTKLNIVLQKTEVGNSILPRYVSLPEEWFGGGHVDLRFRQRTNGIWRVAFKGFEGRLEVKIYSVTSLLWEGDIEKKYVDLMTIDDPGVVTNIEITPIPNGNENP